MTSLRHVGSTPAMLLLMCAGWSLVGRAIARRALRWLRAGALTTGPGAASATLDGPAPQPSLERLDPFAPAEPALRGVIAAGRREPPVMPVALRVRPLTT